MDAEYKLIRSVDPTKIRVNIKEKFAKLTLSSNKKKTEENTQTISRNSENPTVQKRVSRNLINDLIMDQNGNAECYVNPILRMSSSSRTSSDGNRDDLVDMEPLRVSFSQPTLAQNENGADSLSQRISNLTLNVNPFNEETDAMPNEMTISLSFSSYSSDDAITISDSSTQSESIDMITSDIPKSGETADALLPCTFSNDKADRMVAFLRDVSQVRKELEFGGSETTEDTFCPEINYGQFSKLSADTIAKKLASADTESMSHNFESISKNLPDETQPMNNTNFSLYTSNVDGVNMFKQIPFERREMKLANDETVANTTVSSIRDLRNSIFVLSQNKAQLPSCDNDESFINSSTHSGPSQTSITISETCSEAEDADVPSDLIKKETALSTQSEHKEAVENSSSCTQASEVQQSFASINITAKINIKISITQSNDDETDSNGSEKVEIIAINNSTEDEDLPRALTEDCDLSNNQSPLNLAAEKDTTNTNESQSCNDNEDPSFMEHAQKMLNQLYGKAWQTPDAIRTLSLTENNVKLKPKPSTKKITHKNKFVSQKVLSQPEDSILDEFSIFRRNIKTNLDSTRTFDEATATARKCKVKRIPKINSEARCATAPKKIQKNTKLLQTEFETKPKRKGTNYNQRWRQLVTDDSNESSCNASDDERADKTGDEAHSSSTNDSDISWKGSNLSISSCDSESDKRRKSNDKLVYLDLSKDEVEIIGETPQTPLANYDERFNKHLQQVLRSCKFGDRPKLEATTNSHVKSKRILFTPNFGNEDEQQDVHPETNLAGKNDTDIDTDNVKIKFQPMPAKFEPFNKQLEALKTGTPIFKIPSPKPTPKSKSHATKICSAQKIPLEPLQDYKTPPKQMPIEIDTIKDVYHTPSNKYGFLKSLDVCVSKSLCHPDALYYRDNFRLKKDDLAKKLYDLYNENVFENELQVPLIWNKKLLNTAGRCKNKKRMGTRTSVVELSEKVLTSADRLRCTLIHELCHAAAWIFNGEGGHGATWKYWADKANTIFQEIPKIGVCHQYDIEYKYTYKCTLCAAKSHAHSKSKKVENIRCSYCHGAIEVYLNKKDKDGNILPTPVREPKGFAKFVKEKYREYKRPNLKHADVMKMLSNEFAALKVSVATKN